MLPEERAKAMMRIPMVQYPLASATGNAVAFFWNRTGPEELYLYDLDSDSFWNASRGNLSQGNLGAFEWNICWDSTGERLYFPAKTLTEEPSTLVVLDRDGNREQVGCFNEGCIPYEVSDDGRFLIYATAENQLYSYALEGDTEGETTRLSTSDTPVSLRSGAAIGPNGEQVAFQTNDSTASTGADIYVVSITGGNPEGHHITGDESRVTFAGWHPNHEEVLVAVQGEQPRIGLYSIPEKTVEWFGSGQPVDVLPNGEGCLALCDGQPIVHYRDGTTESIGLDGTSVFLQPPSASAFVTETTFVIRRKSRQRPFELYACDIETNSVERVVEADFDGLDPKSFVVPESVTYPGADGEKIDALLWDVGTRPSPVAVIVYGGHQQASPLFNRRVQAFLSLGYSVIRPEHTKQPYHVNEDFAALGRWLASEEWVAKDDRILFGHSHGGYDVLIQLTRWSELWTAGIAWNGITDLPTVSESNNGMIRAALGDLNDNREGWEEHSPITWVEDIDRPLLLLYGTEDPNFDHGKRFYEAIPEPARNQVEYVVLDGQGHFPTHTEEQVTVMEHAIEFLNERVKER